MTKKSNNAAIRISHGMEPNEDKNIWAEGNPKFKNSWEIINAKTRAICHISGTQKKNHALQYVEVSHRNCNWCCCRRRERWRGRSYKTTLASLTNTWQVQIVHGLYQSRSQRKQFPTDPSWWIKDVKTQTMSNPLSIRSFYHADVVILLQYRLTFG